MITLDVPVDVRAFHDAIYAGEILRFKNIEPIAQLVARLRELAIAATAPHDPITLHKTVDHPEAIELLDNYQQASLTDNDVVRSWHATLKTIGLRAQDTAVDRLLARVQTPRTSEETIDLVTAPLDTHRDTWASNLYEQVNWWAPVYDIDESATMELYPGLFETAVPNTSEDFDIVELRREQINSTKVVPRLLEPVTDESAFRVVLEPGDLLAFSGAHLHRSVPNNSDRTRYSLDTRTIHIPDSLDERGAPNVDGNAPWRTPGWFNRIDGTPLHKILDTEATVAHYVR